KKTCSMMIRLAPICTNCTHVEQSLWESDEGACTSFLFKPKIYIDAEVEENVVLGNIAQLKHLLMTKLNNIVTQYEEQGGRKLNNIIEYATVQYKIITDCKVLGIDQSITHRASHHLAFCCPIGRILMQI
ncbi:hypothetical protein ACJX0J_022251, partial [Zea mays]